MEVVRLIDDSTPVATMTAGELKSFLGLDMPPKIISVPADDSKPIHYVYGLAGIQNLFGVSHVTAQKYKNTFLRPAVSQNGRKLVINADLAMQLFAEYKTSEL